MMVLWLTVHCAGEPVSQRRTENAGPTLLRRRPKVKLRSSQLRKLPVRSLSRVYGATCGHLMLPSLLYKSRITKLCTPLKLLNLHSRNFAVLYWYLAMESEKISIRIDKRKVYVIAWMETSVILGSRIVSDRFLKG